MQFVDQYRLYHRQLSGLHNFLRCLVSMQFADLCRLYHQQLFGLHSFLHHLRLMWFSGRYSLLHYLMQWLFVDLYNFLHHFYGSVWQISAAIRASSNGRISWPCICTFSCPFPAMSTRSLGFAICKAHWMAHRLSGSIV